MSAHTITYRYKELTPYQRENQSIPMNAVCILTSIPITEYSYPRLYIRKPKSCQREPRFMLMNIISISALSLTIRNARNLTHGCLEPTSYQREHQFNIDEEFPPFKVTTSAKCSYHHHRTPNPTLLPPRNNFQHSGFNHLFDHRNISTT